MKPSEQINDLRQTLLAEIVPLLPTEQTYVAWNVPLCAGIKYIGPGENLGLYDAYAHQLKPHTVSDMPIEALASLLEQLRCRAAR